MQDTVTHKHSALTIDPVTLEVIRHGLVSIANQIDANIKRTAFSAYIYEYNDFAVGLTDADGKLIAQCTGGMPPFVAEFGRHGGARRACDLRPRAAASRRRRALQSCRGAGPAPQQHGDVHADLRRARQAALIGFFAINVHWIDIGGCVPHSTDIFMEGLQLRSIKLWSKGEPIEEVYRIIENNTRQPVELMGDIAAQLAGCLLGRDLIAELVDKYGVATFARAVEIILDQSEAAARALIRSMPDGVYTHETFLDNDRAGDEPLPIRIKVIVDGDEMTIDYSGIADQVKGPINSGWFGGGQTTARVAFKYLLGAGEMANEGTFRPLKLVLPPGKILSADPTAPMGNYSTPFPTVIDAVIKALETGAARARAGRPFRHPFRRPLPWPARRRHVLRHPRFRPRRLGRLRHPRRLRPVPHHGARRHPHHPARTAGDLSAGAHRGIFAARRFRRRREIPRRPGLPQELPHARRMRIADQPRPHASFPPWGVQGGKEAKPGRFTVVDGRTGAERASRRKKGFRLAANDLVCVETGGGGGYGPPQERSLGLIQRDLDAGYVSAAAAMRDYGITVDADGKARR